MKYDFQTCSPIDLDDPTLAACLSLIKRGCAVAIADDELPQAQLVTVVRAEGKVIATGAIKRRRPLYARAVAEHAKFPFDEDLLEIGYVAREPAYRGNNLSEQIVASLLSRFGSDQLFATTSHPKIKEVLERAGFERKGEELAGRKKDVLSLWIRSK